MFLSSLKSIAVVSLVLSWLLASVAPGLLVHLSVGSRILATASTHSNEVAAVALAMIRGELCGFAAEIEQAETERSETPSSTESPQAKIILGLVESRAEIAAPSRPEPDRASLQGWHSLDPKAPPGPPPRVI